MKKSMDENNLFEPETVISASDENNVRSRWGNLALKILAVLGAFLIWLYAEAMDDPNYTRDFVGIPVTITNNAPNGLTVVSGSNYMVNITVQGNRKMVEELTYEDVEAFVDISDMTEPQRTTLPIEVSLPDGVYLLNKSVKDVMVFVDQVKQKPVPVTIELTGYTAEEGYTVGTPQTNISEIMVNGPETVLDEIVVAKGTLVMSKLTSSVTAKIPLQLYNSEGTEITNAYVKKSVDSVNVDIPLLTSKMVPLAVQFVEDKEVDTSTVDVGISPAAIKVSGTVEALRDIDRISLSAVDLRRLVSNTLTTAIQLPANLINESQVKEAVLTFNFRNTSTKEVVVAREDIRVNNPNGLNYEILDEHIQINLRGNYSQLSMLTAENLTVLLDLSNYSNVTGKANYALTVSVDGIYKKKVYAYGDYKVSVNVVS